MRIDKIPPSIENADRRVVFQKIYNENYWGGQESRSGPGSTLGYTKPLRRKLARCLKERNVKTLLDAPCGDFNWMRHVRLPPGTNYLGADIVPELISSLQKTYCGGSRCFKLIDIVDGSLPEADLWLCRDALFHLPNRDIETVLANFANSSISYLLTTTFDFPKCNDDVEPGGFRPINLRVAPFSLPAPLSRITDFVVPWPPRFLALWSRQQVASSPCVAAKLAQRTTD
jgi:hypothetical protein